MSPSDELPEEDLRPSLMDRVRTWAATDVGGWSLVGGLAVFALIGVVLAGMQLRPRSEVPVDRAIVREEAPPPGAVEAFTLSPDALQKLSYEAAREYNRSLPFSTAPLSAAARFIAPTDDVQNYARALDCLTAAVYYEAASESAAGQAAVAQVVINRSRHPAYPRTICGVVFQGAQRTTGCQFSFTCDGALARPPLKFGWARARAVATAALNGAVAPEVGLATHYHTDWVAPYWAPRLTKLVQIGTHIFYRWPGLWGRPTAFNRAYAPPEPLIAALGALATPIEDIQPAPELTPIDLALPMTPLPSLVAPPLEPLTPSGRLDQETNPLETTATPLPPVVSVAQTAAEREARQATATISDPLSNPGQARPQRRQRLPAPSGW